MKNRIAVIDFGTNTFHLVIADQKKEQDWEVLCRKQIPVKLGKEGIAGNLISPAAFLRGLEATAEMALLISHHNCKEVFAFGTSMLRNAVNAKEFVKEASRVLMTDISVISGEVEAELIYHGVKQAVPFSEEPFMIMDIGGGSVEFIIASNKKVFWKKSYEIGAARLKYMFQDSQPVSVENIQALHQYLDDELLELKAASNEYNISTLVGAAGSFETLAEMDIIKYIRNAIIPVTHEIPLDHFEDMYLKILSSTYDEIDNMPGMVSFRVEMMSIAVLLIKWVKDSLDIRKMIFSDYSLKEGIIWSYRNNHLQDLLLKGKKKG